MNNNEKSLSKKKTKKNTKIRRLAYFSGSLLFIITLTVMFALSFDFTDRKTFSESEKRELAKFPNFSVSTLFSGEYFSDISLWFSDTFPFRDNLISVSSKIKSAIGISQSLSHFSENSGDVIPDAENESQSMADVTANANQTGNNSDLIKPALPPGQGSRTDNDTKSDGAAFEQNFGSIYVYNDSAYEYYNFVQGTADKYVSAVNSTAQSLSGTGINVYNMVIPTSMDITLDDNVRAKLSSSNQKDAINYIYSKIDKNVKTVNIYDLLKAHNSEYIYFGTDHHWTALGAYYAYAQFMTVKGAQYETLDKFKQYQFTGFLGSFYSDTNKNSALEKSPDTVYAYMPSYNISFKMKESGKNEYMDYPLICDATDFSPSYKYLCFIGGDNPISVIENHDLPEGESCVLVKESFGNAFAPYLACHYKYVYVIDYRHYSGDITDFAKENGVSDIIIQNNISMTRNESLVDRLNDML